MRRIAVAFALFALGCGSRIDLSPSAVDWYADAGAPDADDAAAIDSPADSSPEDRRILPLAVGRKWAFDVRSLGTGGSSTCPAGAGYAYVVGETTVQGQPAIRYQPICDSFSVDVVGAGDRLIAYATDGTDASWLWMDTPVEDGHSWQVMPGSSAVWHSLGTVTVFAGTFTDCFRRDEPDASAPTWVVYCRGVGPVQYHIESEGWQAELVGKDF